MTIGPALTDVHLSLPDRREGKVRISYALPGEAHRRVFVTTDRLSAFDRIIAAVPHKGQVLNQLAGWWFERTRHVVADHHVATPDPNVTVARSARPLPVEVVVRGHITGVTSTSLWRQYADGARHLYGHHLPDGLTKNCALPQPLITPTTKAVGGAHDEPLGVHEVPGRGLVAAPLWDEVCDRALALFEVGRRIGAAAGLVLADTKYEFGLADDTGELLLIDEVHTPDSSRWWSADTLTTRIAAGDEPDSFDKETIRRALLDLGYRGDGPPPELPDDLVRATSARYVTAYERLTGDRFVPGSEPAAPRIAAAVSAWIDRHPLVEDRP